MANASAYGGSPSWVPRHFPTTNLLQIHFREMTVMSMRWLGGVFAIAAALGAQSALAQPINGCPDGQAIQASDASGKNIRCVPVPAPVDVSGLQAQINAEAEARAGMDATLLGAIEALQEQSIVGRYAFSGTQSCLNSTFGFNPNFTPMVSTDPSRAAVVSLSTAATTGFRTFNADGTGTVETNTMSINYPGAFYSSGGFSGVTVGGPTVPGGPAVPSGNASTIVQTSTFTWRIEDGRVIIEDASSPGVFTSGNRVGWAARVENVPAYAGVLGKDLRIISLSHENIGVETAITTSPDGLTEFRTPRICHRERTLRKM